MLNKLLILLFAMTLSQAKAQDLPASIHGFKITTLEGKEIDLSQYKGKKMLLVNTASKCGFTPQYEDLEKLYEEHKETLVIIGFPANNFASQEPGSNEEIAAFCEKNYGVNFPMSEKISVKGEDTAPIYQWLTQKKWNKVKDSEVKWNFQKYLIDENGGLIEVFESAVKPYSPELLKHLND